MKLLKNRLFAILLAVLVVVGSTLLNTQTRLGEACAEVEDGFYTSSGAAKSIYAWLGARLDAANGLWTLLINHDAEAAGTLNAARGTLMDAYEARDIAAMYDANEDLQSAFDSAFTALGGYALTASESDALNDYQVDFAGAQKMIDASEYNSTVLAFERTTLSRFPASLLAPLAGVEAPVLYA